jgi:hypothetical protein
MQRPVLNSGRTSFTLVKMVGASKTLQERRVFFEKRRSGANETKGFHKLTDSIAVFVSLCLLI